MVNLQQMMQAGFQPAAKTMGDLIVGHAPINIEKAFKLLRHCLELPDNSMPPKPSQAALGIDIMTKKAHTTDRCGPAQRAVNALTQRAEDALTRKAENAFTHKEDDVAHTKRKMNRPSAKEVH